MHIAEKHSKLKQGQEDKTSVVRVQGLKKSFDGEVVLDGVNLTLGNTENLAIFGKSGTGKSVLLKSIVGLHTPDEGELALFGKNLNELDEQEVTRVRRKIGYLFQGGALYDSMTVRENLKFSLERQYQKISKNEMKDAIEESLANVGLIDTINKYPVELSGGMKKRIALARTLILKPEIVLYDEPTTGLDPITSKEIGFLINKMREKYHISSIIVTHDISCARIASDRVLILKDKRFVVEGRFEDLERSDKEWIRSFFY